ncbi:MAG: amidohydrolase family protein, partial [Oscillospiraceae bacterium]
MFDIAINNGLVVDTRAKTSAPGHIGITGGKIAAVSPVPLQAETVVNAAGLVVSPGFIDVHGHIDGYDYSGRLAALQGITTTVGGNCGLSPIATGDFLAGQNSGGFAINQAELVGHSFSLRKAAGLASPYAPATAEQLAHMLALAEAALQQGAAGISFGL